MGRFDPKAETPRKKAFSWSYSKLKNFESCPRRHWHYDIAKDIEEDEGEELVWGNRVHDAMAKALTGTPLEEDFWAYQKWVDRVACRQDERLYVEQKLALNLNKSPGQFKGAAWFRGVLDVLKLRDTSVGTVGLLVDWKTGKVVEDSVQLALAAALAFAHYPLLKKVRTLFVWLKDGSETPEDFTPDDMDDLWLSLTPRINTLEQAHVDQAYYPKPSKLCKKYCGVHYCEYHGK